jgi:hypothetical protein
MPRTRCRRCRRPRNLKIPSVLIKLRRSIPTSTYFLALQNPLTQFAALNAQFLPLAPNLRVTIFQTDGLVLYDNTNGTSATQITANYQAVTAPTVVTNNHMTRLEAQLAETHREGGAVFRASTTVSGSSFLFWACFVKQRDAASGLNLYLVARLALLVP